MNEERAPQWRLPSVQRAWNARQFIKNIRKMTTINMEWLNEAIEEEKLLIIIDNLLSAP